jgi:tRNA nucleotidyltransferase (CCA-adding enzyme)
MTINELYKILLSDKPSREIKKHEDELFYLIPGLKECKGFKQHSVWHPYDVYKHTLHVIDNTPFDLELRMAALFHDLGKPDTFVLDKEGRGHFPNHERTSLILFNIFADNTVLDHELRFEVSMLIYYHDFNFSKLDEKGYKEMANKLREKEIYKLFELKRADLLAQSKKYHYLLEDYKSQKEKLLSIKEEAKVYTKD